MIHLVVPAALVVVSGLFPTRQVLKWAPVAVANDLDFIFNFFGYYVLHSDLLLHRAVGHTTLIGLPTLVWAVVLYNRHVRFDPALAGASWQQRWRAFGTVPWAYPAVLITVFLESHVLLDMFQGGVTPLWPLLNTYVYPRIIIWVNTQTGMPRLETGVRTGDGAPALSPEYPWLVPEELAIGLMALVAVVLAFVTEARELSAARRTGASPAGAHGADPAAAPPERPERPEHPTEPAPGQDEEQDGPTKPD